MKRLLSRHPAWMGAAVISLFACSMALASTNAWYGGGSYDGYYESRITGAADYPRVHNAAGATNVTAASAFLNGMLVSTGSAPAQVTVYWALDDGARDVAAWAAAAGAGSHTFGDFGEVTLFDSLSHEIAVSEGLFYRYRFFATNTAGETSWAPETAVFQVPAPPAVSTGLGAGVGFATATLNGELTDGIEATIEVHWAATPAGVEPEAWTTVVVGSRTVAGTLDAPNPFRVSIDGLTPVTPYAYRVHAENDYGKIDSPWVEFVTHAADFITTLDLGWSGGGTHDGYYRQTLTDFPLPGFTGGTLIMIR